MASAPNRLRLDKSRPYSRIHGERKLGDPFRLAHFQQDGIHFDAQGLHIDDLVPEGKVRALVDRRLKKAKTAPAQVTEQVTERDPSFGEGNSGGDGLGNGDVPVNLEAWLRGEAKYPWYAITKAVRDRYSVNKTRQVDVIEFLVTDQKIVPMSDVAPYLKALMAPPQS